MAGSPGCATEGTALACCMTPFYFGPPAHRLFGALHLPERKRAESVAVLVCNPLGQEYVRGHRMLKTLCERLERLSVASLRFDYFGTGDSSGADEDCLLSGWQEDIALAHRELVKRSGAAKIIWLGVRLGAVAALKTLQQNAVTPAPQALMLWEPISAGTAYLEQLRDAHRETLSAAFSVAADDLPDGTGDELLGFAMSLAMRMEIAQIDRLPTLGRSIPTGCLLSPTSVDSAIDLPAGVIPAWLESEFQWNAPEALNTAIVPADVLQLLLTQIEALI